MLVLQHDWRLDLCLSPSTCRYVVCSQANYGGNVQLWGYECILLNASSSTFSMQRREKLTINIVNYLAMHSSNIMMYCSMSAECEYNGMGLGSRGEVLFDHVVLQYFEEIVY